MLNIQKDVQAYMDRFKYPYWTMDQMLLKLDEESGELAKEIFKRSGPNQKPADNIEKIGEEISDVLFALTCISNSNKFDLDDSATQGSDLRSMQRHAVSVAPKGLCAVRVYTGFMQQKGKLVDAFRSEDYKPEKLISPVRESTFRMMLEANLYDIDLQGAWDSKMRIRYERDGDRFQQK